MNYTQLLNQNQKNELFEIKFEISLSPAYLYKKYTVKEFWKYLEMHELKQEENVKIHYQDEEKNNYYFHIKIETMKRLLHDWFLVLDMNQCNKSFWIIRMTEKGGFNLADTEKRMQYYYQFRPQDKKSPYKIWDKSY